ncbi:LacI family DNA-binding transcriptional regulator [Victivallis sp. Marseille-Q1083]|uniref:LacI family DNA-binding transcriptional regulator n=1 Tax=Victivallis sp. Marseille-Q1083 TaxID=2717288 RepID=UPI001589A312|nr:LacI family DNA-binding transcriptional regulator [Victivallis sp. Marseille-Q1083]
MTEKRNLTIKEFARLLGVSTATVSRAFSDKGRISGKTRQRIVAEAERLGYHANVHARSLSRNESGGIMLFYPTVNVDEPDYFINEIMTGLNSALHRLGQPLQINPYAADSDAEFESCRRRILDGSTGGVIVVAGDRRAAELAQLARRRGLAYVVVGHMKGMESNTVWFDNEYGAFLAGKYFRDINRRHPAFIGGVLDKRKRRGFMRGLGLSGEEVIFVPGGSGFRKGAQALEWLLSAHPDVDCVLCANDVLAIGLIKAALQRQIAIPQRLSVIGFDDLRFSRQFTPALSSVSLNLFEIGTAAVAMLSRQLQEGKNTLPSEIIECDLVLRESS